MKIIIVGAGKIGRAIVEQLSQEGHDLTVIDPRGNVIEDASNNFDVMGIVGNGASYGIQIEAGIETADVLIAATDSDELNLLCCLIARKAGNCNTIARVRNPIYNKEVGFIREELGLSMTINPEYAAAVAIAQILRFPSAIDVSTFARGRVEMLEFQLPASSILCGCALNALPGQLNGSAIICAVRRDDEVIIPNGNFVIKAGDFISVVSSFADSKSFTRKIGLESNPVRSAMLIGGGRIAYYLAEMLISSGIEVRIVERSLERCEQLSEELPKAIIINGDAANKEVLLEEGLSNTDAFVTLTGIDEGNIFLSMFARSCSQAKIITKVNRVQFSEIIKDFNLGSIIYPKFITAENIVRYVRAMQNSIGSNVRTLYHIVDNKVEALEFYISEISPVVGVPLERLSLKDNLLIACVTHGRSVTLPTGKTKLHQGDTVIVVTTQKGLKDIRDILK